MEDSSGSAFYAIKNLAAGAAECMANFLRIGRIEAGHICLWTCPKRQRLRR